MREVLFRGKDIAGNCHYGDLINLTEELKQICNHNQLEHAHSVNPETLGQYTGLTDKNGKRTLEGDIVKNDWCFLCGYGVVKFGQYKTPDMSRQYQQGHLGFYL